MTKIQIPVVIACFGIMVACQETTSHNSPELIPIIIDDSLFSNYYDWSTATALIPQNDLTIKWAEITKNVLSLTVSYIGGCEDHQFSLIFGTWITETIPPGLLSVLVEDDVGDTCKTSLKKDVAFDLSSIDQVFGHLEKYTGTVSIRIIVPGSDPPHTGLVYEFD